MATTSDNVYYPTADEMFPSGAWWEQHALTGEVARAELRNRILNLETSTSKAMTTQAVQLITPVSGYQSQNTARNQRIPFRLPARASRFRIHVANRNDADDITYADSDLRINQEMFIGKHKLVDGEMTGQFASAPFGTGFGPAVWLADSAERVSDWIDIPLEANTEYLLSYSYYNPDGSPISAGMATGWWNLATGAVDQVDGVTMNKHIQSHLMVWLEVEIPATTPTLAWIGDSLTVGREAEAALHDSPAWMHGMTHGVLPRLHAQAGSRFADWTGSFASSPKWTRWAGVDRPSACVINLGSNDMYDFAATPESMVSTLTTRLADLVPLVRQHVADRIYFATILPRNNQTYSQAFLDARNAWNDYLRTLPHGAEGCFELAAMVADPANPDRLRSIYDSGDGVHLNTAGYARMAQGVTGQIGTMAA